LLAGIQIAPTSFETVVDFGQISVQGQNEHVQKILLFIERAVPMSHQGPKRAAGGLAIQVTAVARDNGFIREDENGNVRHRATELYAYSFDGLILVVDTERVEPFERADLVVVAAQDSESIHHGGTTAISDAGNGYKIQLPGAVPAGFAHTDGRADVHIAGEDGLLFVYHPDQRLLVDDLLVIRREQQ